MARNYFCLVVLIFLLCACSKNDPISLPADKQHLLGVWQAKISEFDNSVTSDNMLIVFHTNHRVSYLRCINRVNGHAYYNFPDSKLISMSDTEFEIAQDIFITDWNKKFTIGQLPYQEKNEWYFIVDKVKLRKLKPGEKSDSDSWRCSDTDKKKTDTTTHF